MRQAILDMDILSFIIDRRHPEVLATAQQYTRVFRYFSFSAITVTEVLKGMHLVHDYQRAREFLTFLDGCEVFPFDVQESVLTASILAELIRTGQQIGHLDPLIAATAIENDRPLVTNNTKHYRRIVDLGFPLELENWREP
jgi:tRNA(fMet)-specific endonuclease VapC